MKDNKHKTRREARKTMRDKYPKIKDGKKRISVGSVKTKDGSYRGTVTYKPIEKDKYKPKKVKHKIKTNYKSTRSNKGRMK